MFLVIGGGCDFIAKEEIESEETKNEEEWGEFRTSIAVEQEDYLPEYGHDLLVGYGEVEDLIGLRWRR